MKRFNCSCGNPVFFDSTFCIACGSSLGFDPDSLEMLSINKTDGHACADRRGRQYRSCRNGWEYDVCNWLIASDDDHERCVSCRLNRTIPDLTKPENLNLWRELEEAKRRLVYSLLSLGLPVVSQWDNPNTGVLFDFLEDTVVPGQVAEGFVTTGHRGGVITINVVEADPAQRESIKSALNESYRTLLGHFRHESAHYYWTQLFMDPAKLSRFRIMFGDERANYDLALEQYYQNGPWSGWRERYISAYASTHPFEDWAETWAHYLHIEDTLETAVSWGVIPSCHNNFDKRMSEWANLASILNQLNRSMGLTDAYPFVIPAAAREKLRFVAGIIQSTDNPSLATEAY